MAPNPHNLTIPHPARGWSDLIGHRRFRYEPGPRGGTYDDRDAFIEGTGIRILEGDSVGLRVHALRFNTFMVVRVHVPHMHVIWSRDRPTAQRRYLYLFVNRGLVEFLGDARHVSAEGGGLCIAFPGREPVEMRTLAPSELIYFTFDESEIAPYGLTPPEIGRISPRSTVFRASYAYLQAIATSDAPEGLEDSAVLRSLTKDVARALVVETQSRDTPDTALQIAQQVIAEQASRRSFTPDELARRCGVSRSTLTRLFAARGMSASREIRRHRAQHALYLLSEHPDMPLSVIAATAGFGSTSAMTRSFEELYEATPGTLRRKARGPRGG